ncbi:MAG: TlpA family protein disulfide reductase [Deltaproteobacteria bacterium]|nr:TlpA family protein disulfide reductase [Nannocystaceae bacterium]
MTIRNAFVAVALAATACQSIAYDRGERGRLCRSSTPEPPAVARTDSETAAVFPTEIDPVPLQADPTTLGDRIRGEVAVIDLWATWCEPCRTTIPRIIRLADAYRDRGLVVLGVHVGPGEANAYARAAGIRYPLYADPDFVLSDRIGTRSVPTVLVVDRAGNIVFRGSELDAAALTIIDSLL